MVRQLSLVLLAIGCLYCAGFNRATATQKLESSAAAPMTDRKVWRVPSRKARVANPVPHSNEAEVAGKAIYARECASCHGAGGRGDGTNAAEVEGGVPAFQVSNLAGQSDGALFYKIVTGRDPMPGYRKQLSEEEVWQIIHHLRVIAPPPLTTPSFRASDEQREGVSSLLAHYAATTRALASGDAARATSSAAQLERTSGALAKLEGVDDAQSEPWVTDLTALGAVARDFEGVTALDEQRELYAKLTDAMCRLVDTFGHAQKQPLRLLQRSMRRKSLAWLELEADSKDPYAGESGGNDGLRARTVRRLAGRPSTSAGENGNSKAKE